MDAVGTNHKMAMVPGPVGSCYDNPIISRLNAFHLGVEMHPFVARV
jgi:hypothetical protein